MQALRTSILLLALAGSANADQLSLTTSKDNTLYEDPIGALSNGAGENFFAGRVGFGGGGTRRRGVIAFDLTSIPPGSVVNSVSLQLNCSQTNTGNQTINLHALSQDWGEGTSVAAPGGGIGASSTPGDATWKHTFYPGSFWTNIGGDYSATVSGSTVVGATGTYVFASTPGMVSDIQNWVNNPGLNFGWCVLGNEASVGTAKRFDTREAFLPSHRPVLVVDFTPITTTYCVAKTNSLGCIPAIGSTGIPSATATSGFVVSGTNVRNLKSGLLFYGINGRAATPFQNGTLCVKAPVRRTPVTYSGGSPSGNDCTGVYAVDMNTFAQGLGGGNPSPALQVPGTVVDCQWWGRDPGFAAPNNTTLTNALEYVIGA